MTALDIIKTVNSSGAELAVIDGNLKAKRLKLLNDETRNQLKKHKAEITRLLIKEHESVKTTLFPANSDRQPFIVAHSWISHHRQKLRQAGWAAPELYRRNRSRGIAWLAIWEDKTAIPSLGKNGEIIFTINRRGRTVIQTAWPHAFTRSG